MPSIIRLLAIIALALNISSLHASDKKQKGKNHNRPKRTKYIDPGAPQNNASTLPVTKPAPHPLRDFLHADVVGIVEGYKGDLTGQVVPEKDHIIDICFFNSGNRLALASKHAVIAYDIESNTAVGQLSINDTFNGGHYVIDLNRDDSLLAAAEFMHWKGEVTLWDTKTSKKKIQLESDSDANVVKFSPSGSQVATGDRSVKIFDVTRAVALRNLELPREYYANTNKDIVWFNDNKRIAALRDPGEVRLFDTTSGRVTTVFPLTFIDSDVQCKNTLALTADNTKLIAAAVKKIVIFDLVANKELRSIPVPDAITIPQTYFTSATVVDSTLFATTNNYSTLLQYDIENGQRFDQPQEGKQSLEKVIYCPQKQCFATLSPLTLQLPVIKLWKPEKIQ